MTTQPLTIDYALLYGNTSGNSPIADHVGDEWDARSAFMDVWGWTLWNNGLVIESPITLN